VWIVAVGAGTTGVVLAVGFWGEPWFDTGLPTREVAIGIALRVAAGIGVLVAGLLAWGRLELSRREHALQRDEIAQRETIARADREQRDASHVATHALAIKSQLDERFVAAVKLLGDTSDPAVRMGGLYALEALAHDHVDPTQRQAIYDVICGYLREHAPTKTGDKGETIVDVMAPLGTDYHAAATVALRAPADWNVRLDLARTHLVGHTITTDLAGSDFMAATLTQCKFQGATLIDCIFAGAKLRYCGFWGTELRNCEFGAATLSWCGFRKDTRLGNCSFVRATLDNCEFIYVEITNCYFLQTSFVDCDLPILYRDDCTFDLISPSSRIRWNDDSAADQSRVDIGLHYTSLRSEWASDGDPSTRTSTVSDPATMDGHRDVRDGASPHGEQ
jgi:hypothetical protein